MALRIKRIYEDVSEADGQRIFVDRIWARGVSKEAAALTDWKRDVAPSAVLRKEFGHDPAKFDMFKQAYEKELTQNPATPAFIDEVGSVLKQGENVTLLFGAKDVEHNNAVVLRDFTQRRLTK